ncbi:adenylosuccinate synthetase [Candidatus Woesearchaeota archaeon]|nr:adenylosuccinate synthetase [Candidatus Woesearchaeota archaeon]
MKKIFKSTIKPGKSIVGVGLQYGDEGKIKIFDQVVPKNTDIWARFNGGSNAGHNLQCGNLEIITHAVPSFFPQPNSLGYIGSGCVVNAAKIWSEIEEITVKGFPLQRRLFISPKCTLIQPHHVLIDQNGGKEVGTTGNGIGPAYADQAQRQLEEKLKNIRLGDYLKESERMKEHVRANLEEVCGQYGLAMDTETCLEQFDEAVQRLAGYVAWDSLFLLDLVEAGKNVFFEGANSVLLDAVVGDVPYVTSSRTLAVAAYTGGDLSVDFHNKTIGVAKAIVSRVGNGPFITELGGRESEEYCKVDGGKKYVKEVEKKMYNVKDLLHSGNLHDLGIALRMLGGEYGATTCRPRRIGMLDLVMLRESCRSNGVKELYINKFDCLTQFSRSSLPGIPVVTAYELDGKKIDYVPSTTSEMYRAKPVIEYFPHIKEDISSVRRTEDLPETIMKFIGEIENAVGVPVYGIGVGPRREEFVRLK